MCASVCTESNVSWPGSTLPSVWYGVSGSSSAAPAPMLTSPAKEVPPGEVAQMAAKTFGIEIASCAAGKKMGLCAEPAAKEVCALSCGECEAAQ